VRRSIAYKKSKGVKSTRVERKGRTWNRGLKLGKESDRKRKVSEKLVAECKPGKEKNDKRGNGYKKGKARKLKT